VPLIVMGDWNAELADGSDAAAILLRGAGLRDAWGSSMLRGSGNTFGHDTLLTQSNFDRRIDYISGRGGVAFSAVRTIDTPVDPSPAQFPRWVSDHKFVAAIAYIPAAQ
jgi:hypothetical protein